MVKLIINADDFGKSKERNRAINDSFKQGIIFSAGLIVTGQYLQEAVEYINNGGYIKNIHLHFNLSTNLLHEKSNDIPISKEMQKDSFFCEEGKFLNYHGLSSKITDIRKWRVVLKELVAQFEKFKEVTAGKANYKHVDFHLWYNLTWPVTIALNLFTWKYRIESVRYLGIHQMNNRRNKIFRILSYNPRVKYIPATNIDYFLTMNNAHEKYNIIELYCHPNYKDGVFLDDSPSYLNHDRQPMQKQIQMLNNIENVEFVSWEDIS